MKKVSSVLLVCVLVIGIVIFLSPLASALQIVGDPIEGNSFQQYFCFDETDGEVDEFELSIDGGEFTDNALAIDDPNWDTDQLSNTLVSAVSALSDGMATEKMIATHLLFGVSFNEPLFADFCVVLKTFINGVLKNLYYLEFCDGKFSISVPDADIMWLLGPALIGLGLIGRKKYRTIKQ